MKITMRSMQESNGYEVTSSIKKEYKPFNEKLSSTFIEKDASLFTKKSTMKITFRAQEEEKTDSFWSDLFKEKKSQEIMQIQQNDTLIRVHSKQDRKRNSLSSFTKSLTKILCA